MQTPNKIARTGRVQQWIDNPTNRLPVSCTIFNVEDSMEGSDGIEASWRFVSHALYAMEQESQSTCRTLDRQEQKQIRDLIHLLQVDQSHSQKSTQH